MSDTNDMRREFEAWYSQKFDDQCVWDKARNCYLEIGCHLAWKGWQSATERATAPQWLSIETAPKDRNILLAAEFYGPGDWRIKMGGWADDGKKWELFGASWTPTHWMPLPPPPAIGQGDAV